MSTLKIGVLALQGDFHKHLEMIESLGFKSVDVRTPKDLALCDGLIIPGGESTTIYRQLNFIKLLDPLKVFASQKPVFGTCAGLILMSKKVAAAPAAETLALLEITVERNAYGRQFESFKANVQVTLSSKETAAVPALFIRAPRIREHSENVKVLAAYNGEPVLIQQGLHLGATFHPELTSDTHIHRLFCSIVQRNKDPAPKSKGKPTR